MKCGRSRLALSLAAALLPYLLLAQELRRDKPVFKARTDAVNVDVLVTKDGRPVGDLTATDFELADNGVPQRISLIEVEQAPVNVIAALDTSGSVRGELWDHLSAASTALVNAMHPQDRMSLLAFASNVRLVASWTADREELSRAITSIDPSGRTRLRDAVFATLALRTLRPERTLALVFSDDRDTASWLRSAKVLEAAKRTDLVLYAVSVADLAEWKGEHRRLLEELAAETGGRVIRVGRRAKLDDVFSDVLSEFRNRYVLSYEPTDVASGGWHELTVTTPGRRANVKARRGYFAEAQP